jgi:hypothetical protein
VSAVYYLLACAVTCVLLEVGYRWVIVLVLDVCYGMFFLDSVLFTDGIG